MTARQMPFPWFFLLLVPLVGAMTDSPRVFHPTERKEISDFEVPQGLIGAEREILHLGPRKKTDHDEAEDSHPVTYSIPFDKEHFVFENDDWDVFTLPNSEGEQMVVSTPSNVTKTITILTTIRKNLEAVLRYQIHLTAGEAPVSPSLLVFLVDNGTRVLLKEEFPEEVWRNSSIHLRTVGESQLLFVGVLHDERNKIVLRSLTLEIAPFYTEQYGEETSNVSEGEHFLTGGESPQHSEDVANHSSAHDEGSQLENGNVPAEVDYDDNHKNTSSYATSDTTEDASVNDTNANSEDTTTDPLEIPEDGMDANDPYQYSSNVTEESSSPNETSEATQPSNDMYDNELDSEFSDHSKNESAASPSTPVHLSSGDNQSSDASSIFNFFIVIMLVSFVIIGILWWRRRKGKEDDEIPVFSRNATEHGNPTFAETEENTEVGLNTETPSNYRSFR